VSWGVFFVEAFVEAFVETFVETSWVLVAGWLSLEFAKIEISKATASRIFTDTMKCVRKCVSMPRVCA